MSRRKQGNPRHLKSDLSMLFVDDLDTMPARHDTNPAAQDDKHMMEVDEEYGDCDLVIDTQPGTSSSSAAPSGGADGISISSSTDHKPNEGSPRTSRLSGCEETKDTKKQENGLAHNSRQPLDGEPNNNLIKRSIRNGKVGAGTVRSAPSQMSSHKTSPAALVAAQQPVFNTPSKVSTAGGHQTTVLPTDFHAPLSVATGPLGEFPVAGLDSTASNHVTPPRISHHPGIQGAYSGQVTPSSAGSSGSGGAGVNMPNSPAPSTSSVHSNRSNHSEGNSSATKSKLSQPSKARRKNDKILPVADLRGEIYVCPVCTMSLDSQTALTKHIRSHNTHDSNSSTNNECTICGKVLSSQSSLDRHMLVHSGERPFSCKICNMSFTTNGNMHRHARIHKKDAEGSPLLGVTTPNKNDDGSNSARSSNTGSASGTGRKRRLDAGAAASSPTLSSIKKRLTMNDDMTTPRTMIHPTSDHKIMPFPPTLVQQQMQQQQYQMAAFMRQLQTDIASKCEPSVYEDCYLCLQKFATQEHLKEHVVSQHQLPSSESNEHVVSQPEENSHLTCEICHITYKTKEILNQHVESTHCDNHDNMEDSPCSIQQNAADSRSNTSSPLPGFEPLSFTEFSANKFSLISSRHCTEARVCKLPGGTNQQSYPCPDPKCDLKFPCHSAQSVHYKTHRYQSGLACKQCQCGFDDESSYTQHMLRHHVPHSIMKSLKPKSSPDDIEHNTDEEPVLEQEGFLILCGLKRKPTVNVQSNDSISSMAHVRQQLSSGISPAAKFPTVDSHLNLQQQEMLNFLKLQEQQYAMLSANFSANQTQHVFPLASHYPQQDVAAFTDNFNNKSTPSKGMKLPHIVSPPRPHLSSLSVEESDNQIFSCKFCTSSFQELDAYKDHISSKHVGLSFSDVASDICPLFTCESCEFKNASRRHIVNHLRTHAVDSWPFQCRICESAFVNRQSCEKHISNEHGSDYSRSEVQSAVGYNGSLLSAARSILPPQELTCKYCGTSFTAQSSLVHHLLEKRGCLYRPFACLLCSNGFSTRENCTRHIHGQHAEVPLRFIDICIYVTETAEHTSRRNGAEKGNNTRNARLQMPLGTSGPWAASNYISTPPVVKVKQELQDEDHNQPLDFSVKSGSASIGKQSLTSIKVEEPMDLSSGQPSSHQEKHAASMQKLRSKIMENTMVHSSPSLAPPKQVTPTAANGLTYLCRLCAKTFIDHSILQAHIRQQHSDVIREHPPPKDGIITQSRNKPVPVSEIAAAIQASTTVMATHTESNVADQPITSNAPTTIMTSTTGNGRPIASSSTDNTTSFMSIAERLRQCKQQQEILRRARQQQHPRVAHKVTPNRNALVSSDDLSSVHQMMDVTDPANFKAIFASIPSAPVPQISSPTTVDSGSKLSSQPAVTAADDMDTSSIKPVQPSVVLMDNCLTASPTVPLNIKSDYSSVDIGEPHKKKRNSYAESPHRLQCPYCPRAFPWISSLNRHLLTHTGQKPFKCPKCPVMFSTKSNRERHLIRKHGLNVHDPATRQMMDRPFKCHMCVFSSFASAGNLMKHYLDKHPEAKLPEHVKREFSNETLSQARHEQLIAAAAKANGTEAVKSELLRDEESGGGTEEDDEDDYMEEDNVSQRNIVVTVPFAAAIGGRRGAGPVTSAGGSVEMVTGSAHIGAVPPQLHGAMAKVTSAVVTTQANSTQQRNKVITSLPATFLTNANRTIDIAKTKMPAALNITRDKTPTPPPALVKPVVNGGVAPVAQQNLTTTVRILTPTIVKCTRPTTAPTITPTVLQSATLSAGVPDVNPERDNYNVDRITNCWKCGLVFDHRKDLLRHLKEHNIDLPYKCYLCDASYMTRSDSLKHILTSHVTDWNGLKRKNQIDDPTEFCQVVDNIVTQNFLNTEGEMFNIRVHDLKKLGFNDDLKPESDYVHRKVYCTLCPKRFWSLQDLRRHMRSHTGERPFECDVCSKRFTLKHSMMRHRRKHTSSEVLAARSQQHRNSPSVGDSLHTQSSSTPSDSDDEVSAADGAVRAGLPNQLHLQPQPTQRTAALCDDASSDGDDDDDDDYNNNISSSIAAASSCNTQDLKSSLQNIAQAAMSKLSSKSVTPDIRTLAGALTASFDRRIGAGGKEKSTINSSVPGLVAAAPVQAPVLTAVQNPGSKLAVSIKQTPVENLPARGSDLLQSLLGVETSAIDKMLDSVTDSAAVILGVQNGGSK